MNLKKICSNSEVYEFILTQSYRYYPSPIHLNDWIKSVAGINSTILNPLLDVTNKMIGYELEMINATDCILTTRGIEAAKQTAKEKDCD